MKQQTKSILTETVNDITMIIDTDRNIITAYAEGINPIEYHFKGDLFVSDFDNVRQKMHDHVRYARDTHAPNDHILIIEEMNQIIYNPRLEKLIMFNGHLPTSAILWLLRKNTEYIKNGNNRTATIQSEAK